MRKIFDIALLFVVGGCVGHTCKSVAESYFPVNGHPAAVQQSLELMRQGLYEEFTQRKPENGFWADCYKRRFSAVAARDMDGDGDEDIVAGCYSKLVFFENVGDNSNPQYLRREVLTNLSSSREGVDIEIRDVDRDGRLDVVVSEERRQYFLAGKRKMIIE